MSIFCGDSSRPIVALEPASNTGCFMPPVAVVWTWSHYLPPVSAASNLFRSGIPFAQWTDSMNILGNLFSVSLEIMYCLVSMGLQTPNSPTKFTSA